MDREAKLFMALLLAAGLTACNPESETPGEEAAEEAVGEQVDQAQAAFNRTAKSRIEAMEEQMDRLAEHLDQAPEDVREKLNAQTEDWRRRADDLENRIESFDANTDQEWREFETRVNAELDELDRTLNDLSQQLTPPAR